MTLPSWTENQQIPAALAPWLEVERFDYAAAADDMAVLELLAKLRGIATPNGATLLVFHAEQQIDHPACRSVISRPVPGASPLWYVSFELSLELVQCPDSMFELRSSGRVPLALPAPSCLLLDGASLHAPRRMRRRALTVAAALALSSAPITTLIPAASAATLHSSGHHLISAKLSTGNHIVAKVKLVRLQHPAAHTWHAPAGSAQAPSQLTPTQPRNRHTGTGTATPGEGHHTTTGTPGKDDHTAAGKRGKDHPATSIPADRPSAGGTSTGTPGKDRRRTAGAPVDHRTGTDPHPSGGAGFAPETAPGASDHGTDTGTARATGDSTDTSSGTGTGSGTAPAGWSETGSGTDASAGQPGSSTGSAPNEGAKRHRGTGQRSAGGWRETVSSTRTWTHASGGEGVSRGAQDQHPQALDSPSSLTTHNVTTHVAVESGGGRALSGPEAAALARLARLFATSGDAQPPAFLVALYKQAGRRYHVPWVVLAAINAIETNYGRNLSVSSAGAEGWMQFMPDTWRQWGVSAEGHGRADPYDPRDAIFSAARYLQASGAQRDLRAAVFAYNHANWYVDEVLALAAQIAAHNVRPGADARVKIDAMKATAQLLDGLPYVWGGGHGGWVPTGGYDCSGFVSKVLHAGGYLDTPQDTQSMASAPGIATGPGKWVTIFDRTNGGSADRNHVIILLDGQWWESGGSSTAGSGSTVHQIMGISPSYLASFNRILHPEGL